MTSPVRYKIAFVANEITSFIRDHDSTWVMMKAAHELGHQVYYALANDLQEDGTTDYLKLSNEFFAKQKDHLLILDQASIDSRSTIALDDFDYIFMRKDPPVDQEYIRECKIMVRCKNAKIINKPESLINLNEKLMILNFPDLIIDTLVTDDISEIEAFVTKHEKVVMKPLDGFGGAGISLLERGGSSQSLSEKFSDARLATKMKAELTEPSMMTSSEEYNAADETLQIGSVMLQKYIPDIKEQGDKRIIVVNGKPIGALLRIPPENDFRANLAVGGSYAKYVMNDRDREICAAIKPFLLEHGIYFAGVDLIGDYLTEINITSPTCLQEINRVEGYKGRDRIEYRLILLLF